MKLFVLVGLTAVFALMSSLAGAQGITIGRPGYGGPGCPAGTASASLSSDGTTLRVTFDRFQASAGGRTGRSFDRKSCNLSIPVSVPSGKSVSLLSVDYGGRTVLPASATAQLNVETFFAGGTGPVYTRRFTGPRQQGFTASERFTAATWSACGADVILRINSSLRVAGSGRGAASISVRSQDVRTALVYKLRSRSC